METFTAIFTQLGVDSSLVPQLIIVAAIFIAAQFLFLGKLQEVLEIRDEKTVKLENSAEETLETVDKMKSEYSLKIEKAHRSALESSSSKKQEISQKYTAQYKQTEKEVSQYVEDSRTQFSKEVASNKQKYLSEAETLAQSLVNKILQ